MKESSDKKHKLGIGFYVCSISYALERCAFYSAKWLIAAMLIANASSGGLGLEKGDAAIITSYLVASTYFAPIIGAYVSDRWIGARYLIPLGMLLIGGGYLIGWKTSTVEQIYFMITLVAIGTALFKSQTNALTGRVVRIDELSSAFSTRYSLANIGSFSGTLLIGVTAATLGFSICFLICAIIMFISIIWFVYGWRYLGEAGKRPFVIDERKEKHTARKEEKAAPLTQNEKKRVLAIFIITVLAIIFWLFWYMSFTLVYYHWNGENPAANWVISGFAVPSSWFDSLNSLCCIVFGPLLAILWRRLAQRPQGDISMFKKIALGIISIGIGYFILAATEIVRGESQANLINIIMFGIMVSLGEIVFSPLGNAFVSQFAPAKILSNMMSVWALAMFTAASLYGYLYEYSLQFDSAVVFGMIAMIAVGFGTVLWFLQGKLNKIIE